MHKDGDACSQLLSLDVLLCWVNRLRLLSLQMTTSKTAPAILKVSKAQKEILDSPHKDWVGKKSAILHSRFLIMKSSEIM